MPLSGGGGAAGADALTALTSGYYVYRNVNTLGSSDFVATIATLPGGAVLTHNVPSSGDADFMTYNDGTNQPGMLVLHNTTRGTEGLVRDYATATRTITLNDTVDAGWQVGDTVTLRSQTADTGALPYCFDLDLSEFVDEDATFIFVQVGLASTNATMGIYVHPYETYGAGKAYSMATQVNGYTMTMALPVSLTSKRICFRLSSWANNTTALWFRSIGETIPV